MALERGISLSIRAPIVEPGTSRETDERGLWKQSVSLSVGAL